MKAFVVSAVLAAGALAQIKDEHSRKTQIDWYFDFGTAIKPAKEPKTSHAEYCMTVASGSTKVTIEECEILTDYHRKWDFREGAFRIHDQCLHVKAEEDGSAENGTKLFVHECDESDHQWVFLEPENQFVWADSKIWTKCLDFTDATPGNQAQLWDCHNDNTNQIWEVLPNGAAGIPIFN